jgi:hypothetical protein
MEMFSLICFRIYIELSNVLDKGHGHGGSDMLQYIIIIASLVHFDSLYYLLRLHRLSKKMACNPYIEQPANPLILFKNSSHRLLTLHKLGGVVWKAFDRTTTHMHDLRLILLEAQESASILPRALKTKKLLLFVVALLVLAC